MEFSGIKVGVHLVLKGKYPCRINKVNLSRPGKHGHAKKLVVGVDVITDKKYEEIFTHHSNIVEPKLKRTVYQLSYIDDGYMFLMGDEETREDIQLPYNDLGREMKKHIDKETILLVMILEIKELTRVLSYTFKKK